MKSKFLFPTWGALVGYLLTIPGFILGYLNIFNDYDIPGFGFRMREKDTFFESAFENFTNELAIFLVIVGLILVAFSKSKREDELNAKLRLNSLYWSVMIYFLLYILGLFYSLAIGEIPFIGDHASEINIFTPLLIFIGRFYYLKYFNNGSYLIDKPRFLSNRPFKKIGITLASISFLILMVIQIIDLEKKWPDSVMSGLYFCLIVGLLLWVFSQNKIEDEMTMQQRLESLQLAVYFNYAVLLIATILFYSFSFLYVLMFAQFSVLLFFVIRMEYVNYKNNQLSNSIEGGVSYEK